MKKEYLTLSLLVVLNIVIRYPITPHETGLDSFVIHNLANSILESDTAKWIIHPLSFFGLYVYSYPSAVPYLLAVCSLVTGLGMEWTTYVVSLLLGIAGMFAAFVMAGEFKKDVYFRLLVALIYSVSPLSLKFTVWTVSARGMFLMLLPLLIWSLMRIRQKSRHNYLLLAVLLFVLLLATHKMTFLTIIIIFTYPLARLSAEVDRRFRVPYLPQILLFVFIGLSLAQFFIIAGQARWAMNSALEFFPSMGRMWYEFLVSVLFEIIARFGFLLPLAFLGLISIMFKKDRTLSEWFLILTALLFAPLISLALYVYQVLLPIFSLFATLGILYVVRISDRVIHKKYFATLILFTLLCFSFFTLYIRYTSTDQYGYSNYMYPSTFSMTKFIQRETENKIFSGPNVFGVSAFVTNPALPEAGPDILIYDFVDKNELNIGLQPFPRGILDIAPFVKYPYYTRVHPPSDQKVGYLIESKNSAIRLPNKGDNVYENRLEVVMYLEEN